MTSETDCNRKEPWRRWCAVLLCACARDEEVESIQRGRPTTGVISNKKTSAVLHAVELSGTVEQLPATEACARKRAGKEYWRIQLVIAIRWDAIDG
jgi:hypothetical protein